MDSLSATTLLVNSKTTKRMRLLFLPFFIFLTIYLCNIFHKGVINKNESKRAKYTLKASNGSTHKLLRQNETVHDAIEFGKISYYKLDLENIKYANVT